MRRQRTARWLWCALLAFATGCVAPRAPSSGDMIAVCRAQEAAWNRGDLEAFMALGYWRSAELTFFSGGNVTHGYDAMLEHYRERYTRDGREMGKLSFTELEEVALGSGAGLLRGRWNLTFSDGKTTGGLFTLAMQKRPEGWRIVHDHTSQ